MRKHPCGSARHRQILFLSAARAAFLALPLWPIASSISATRAEDVASRQWYTGSLMSPSGALPAGGLFVVEPYAELQCADNRFDAAGRNHALAKSSCTTGNFTAIKYGVTRSLTLQAIPTLESNKNAGKWGRLGFGDLPVDAMWRVLDEDLHHRYPTLSLQGGIGFPTGRYQKLHAPADATGSGLWRLRLGLAAQSLQMMPTHRPLRLRGWLSLQAPLSRVSVQGTNAYGVPASMKSAIEAGPSGQAGLAGEYGVTRRWVLAFDLVRNWSNGTEIHRTGKNASPASGDWEFAPAIEYNGSAKLGIVSGIEIPLAGHNEAREYAAQVAVNMVF